MAVSLEARVPLLDHELVEFMAALPARQKIRGLRTKFVSKEALPDLVPNENLQKSKHGFAVPTDTWRRSCSMSRGGGDHTSPRPTSSSYSLLPTKMADACGTSSSGYFSTSSFGTAGS